MQPNNYKVNGKRVCNPVGWFLSEKYDGMKARWIDGKLLTRSGLALHPPEWFVEMLPKKSNIEGELYLGKNTFHKTAGLRTTSISGDVDWKQVTYYVFDLIDYEKTWLERQGKLKKIYPKNSKHICVVEWKEVERASDVESALESVTGQGGEGVVLANPWGVYEDGHVDQILKYKKMRDKEAIVTGYNFTGQRLESLNVRDPHGGQVFKIGGGFSVKDRYGFEKKYPVGCTVTYLYEVLYPTGKPRAPIFKGVRVDL